MLNFLLRFPFCLPTLLAALFGLLFPVSTVLFMLYHEDLSLSWDNIIGLHVIHFDLFILWTAPLVLAAFGSLIGKTTQALKEKMDTLQSQTLQLNSILDTAASGIISIDAHGSIIKFNRAAEQIFGYKPDEIIGQNIKCLMPQAISVEHDGYLENYRTTGKPRIIGQRREVEALRKNGQTFPALLRVNPMLIDGETFFSGVIDDISETKTLQIQLDQAQKMEAIGQLASGVAHEINTPVQFIGDNLSALADNIRDIVAYQAAVTELADPQFQQQLSALTEQYDLDFILDDSPKAINQALDGVKRVAEIIKAMKTFSHVEASLSKQTINLHEALNSALTITRNSYKYTASVETDFAKDIGNISCYANELNQVFLNLIVNAVHAIEEKQAGLGLIRIVTRKLGDMVEILIQDNGAGIPKDIQEKVFNLFFTTKEVGKGTGQGLSLSHTIVVEKHRGKLFFESSAGVGTTFHIQLPLTD